MARPDDRMTVLPPSLAVQGRSQAQLGDAWWQAVYALPAEEHFGLFDDHSDPRGRRGSVEKLLEAPLAEDLLFIGGAFGEITTDVGTDGVLRIERTIVLPNDGQATLFLPLLNGSFDNLVNDPLDPDNLTGDLDPEALRGLVAGLFNTVDSGGLVSELHASVNQQPITDLLAYRQASPEPFTYTTPYPIANSLLATIGYSDLTYLDNPDADPIQLKDLKVGDAVSIGPAVADGYWLAVEVAGGDHVLNFGGTLTADGTPFFALDVTYNVLNPVAGTSGRDVLNGRPGHDYLEAGEGGDRLFGHAGDDLLLAGGGDDVIDGGVGSDELWGDAGRDVFVFRRGYGEDSIFDFSSGETVTCPGLRHPILSLASDGVSTRLDFGGGDVLTLIGIPESDLLIQRGSIAFA